MTNRCEYPSPLGYQPSPMQLLEHAVKVQSYVLCTINCTKKVMEDLAVELANSSMQAGYLVRDMVYNFRNIEMAYLADSRPVIKRLSDAITPIETTPVKVELNNFDMIFGGISKHFTTIDPTEKRYSGTNPGYPYRGGLAPTQEWANKQRNWNDPRGNTWMGPIGGPVPVGYLGTPDQWDNGVMFVNETSPRV